MRVKVLVIAAGLVFGVFAPQASACSAGGRSAGGTKSPEASGLYISADGGAGGGFIAFGSASGGFLEVKATPQAVFVHGYYDASVRGKAGVSLSPPGVIQSC